MTRRILFLVIGLSGAATLLLEVTATRLLAPYFGNSIYVVSSVLAVVLGFLSLGYWLGGLRAERQDPSRVLFLSILGAGASGLLISTLMVIVVPPLGLSLPLTWGPLIVSILLFSAPSTFLGMVAPAAVRLHPLAASVPSRASGEVLAVSTIGSIAGSLLGGFLLLPTLGLRRTLLATALGLLLLGLAGFRIRTYSHTLLILLLVLAPGLFFPWTWFLPGLVYEQTTPYQHVLVIDHPKEGTLETQRFFLADHALMSGQDRESGAPVFAYVDSMLELLGTLPRVERVAVLGSAAFTIPRVITERFPTATVDAIEIDAALPAIAERYFALRPDDRLRIHLTDGRRFLRDAENTYDAIILDMFHSINIPTHTTTQEFFALVRTRLAPDGIVLMNIVGEPLDRTPSLPRAIAASARAALPHQTFIIPEPLDGVGNIVLLASAAELPLHGAIPTAAGVTETVVAENEEVFTDDRFSAPKFEAALARALRSSSVKIR